MLYDVRIDTTTRLNYFEKYYDLNPAIPSFPIFFIVETDDAFHSSKVLDSYRGDKPDNLPSALPLSYTDWKERATAPVQDLGRISSRRLVNFLYRK